MIWQTRQPLNHLREKFNWQNNFAKQTGLRIIVTKTQVIYWCQYPYNTPNHHQWKGTTELDCIDHFTYLEGLTSSDNGAHKDTKARLIKARSAFSIWKSERRYEKELPQ